MALKDLANKLKLKPPYHHYRQKIDEAIRSGLLAPYCGLERYSDEVANVLGSDSLNTVEIVMAVEEWGRPVQTVGELLRMLEELDGEHSTRTR